MTKMITVPRELLEQALDIMHNQLSIVGPTARGMSNIADQFRAALAQPQQERTFTVDDMNKEYSRGVDYGHQVGLIKAREAIGYKEAYNKLIERMAKIDALNPSPRIVLTVDKPKVEQQERTCGTCRYELRDVCEYCTKFSDWEPKQ